MSTQLQLLQVLADIEMTVGAERLPIVLFDLDDTLFCTSQRDLLIIREFAADHRRQYPDFYELSQTLVPSQMGWSVTDALVAAGLSPNNEALGPFKEFWSGLFFSDTYSAFDLPNPGAVDYVWACYNAGALVYYLTGRGVSARGLTTGMEQGTARSLTTRGFPFWTGRAELELKKNPKEKDADYKARALALVKSLHGSVVATFDNEPANVNVYMDHFPEARNFWVKTTWNPTDPPPKEGAISIPDFSV